MEEILPNNQILLYDDNTTNNVNVVIHLNVGTRDQLETKITYLEKLRKMFPNERDLDGEVK